MARADDVGLFWQDYASVKGARGEVFRPTPPIPKTGWRPPDYFPDLRSARMISLDLETYDPDLTTKGPGPRRTGFIAGVAVGTDDGFRGYYPIRHKMGGNLDPDKVLEWLSDQLEGTTIPKVGANLLYDLDFLRSAGCSIGDGPNYDVQNAEPLLDEYKRSYALDILGQEYLGEGKSSEALYRWSSAAFGGNPTAGDQGRHIWQCPVELVGPYAEGDVDLPLRIFEQQKKRLEEQNLMGVFDLETRLVPCLLAMRQRGIRIDFTQAALVEEELAGYIKTLSKDLNGLNVNVSDEIKRLCDKLGIKYPRTAPTKAFPNGQPSFQKDWLKNHENPLMRKISELRTYQKYKDTFITSYLHGNQVNGRIHTSFNQLRSDEGGTVTGRFSSSNPNLQNIPKRGKGKIMRSPFVPEADEDLVRFDWSQIEFRLLVHKAIGEGAKEAREMYNNDPATDFHDFVISLTGLERDYAKNINFGFCIAEGQRVLTNSGWVAIENVALAHRLWDGIQWVSHEGVIYKGERDVITYAGLTATVDHTIYTKQHGALSFGRCSSERKEIARRNSSPVDVNGLRYAPRSTGNDKAKGAKERQAYRLLLRSLQGYENKVGGQHTGRDIEKLSLSRSKMARSKGCDKVFRGQVRRDTTALQHVVARIVTQLHRSRDRVPIRIARALHNLGFEDIPSLELQRYGFRPNRQRRALRAEQLTSCNSVGEPNEQRSKTYDIYNAGPRRRFTCEGVVVSNCFGMGIDLLCKILGVDRERGMEIINAYHKGVPFVKKTADAASRSAQSHEVITTILGRRARFPGGEFTHKALNRYTQGSSADIMKASMVEVWESGICDVLGAPLLTVHDELLWSAPRTREAKEALAECKNIMENTVKLRVPTPVAFEIGSTWHNCKEVEGYLDGLS